MVVCGLFADRAGNRHVHTCPHSTRGDANACPADADPDRHTDADGDARALA